MHRREILIVYFFVTYCNRVVVSSQFGAFHFGARQFDACQFGALHFDAVPVRRVSVWRDASLACFTLARFPFWCLC